LPHCEIFGHITCECQYNIKNNKQNLREKKIKDIFYKKKKKIQISKEIIPIPIGLMEKFKNRIMKKTTLILWIMMKLLQLTEGNINLIEKTQNKEWYENIEESIFLIYFIIGRKQLNGYIIAEHSKISLISKNSLTNHRG